MKKYKALKIVKMTAFEEIEYIIKIDKKQNMTIRMLIWQDY